MDTRCGSTVWGWRLCPDHGGVGREPPNPRRRRRRRRAGADTPGVRKPAARQARPCLLIHTEAGQLPVLLAPFVSGCRTAAALSTSRWKGRAVHLAAQGSQGRTPGPASRQPGDAGRRRGRDAARSDAAGRGLVGGRARRAPTGDPARVVRRIEWDAAWPALLGPTARGAGHRCAGRGSATARLEGSAGSLAALVLGACLLAYPFVRGPDAVSARRRAAERGHV